MIKKNLVSVLMSTHNSEKTIRKAIESIINQTYKDLEFLIVDDCSDDNTYKIIKDYSIKYNFIKIFQNESNIGLTKSLNKLIKNSNGKFIARQDADDESLKERLDLQISNLIKNDVDFCVSRAIDIQSKNKIPRFSNYLPTKYVLKYKNPFIHGTLLIKKTVIENIGAYDEKFYYAQDYKLFKNLIEKDYSYIYLNKPLYKLNTKNNISTNKKDIQSYYANCVKRNIEPDGRN